MDGEGAGGAGQGGPGASSLDRRPAAQPWVVAGARGLWGGARSAGWEGVSILSLRVCACPVLSAGSAACVRIVTSVQMPRETPVCPPVCA